MPLSTENSSQYHLNLQPQKENVFVTQLNDRQDDDIRRFPIVKESADKLLQTGVNTLQSTSLLRQAVEVEHVDKELAEKREEFRQRMEVCKAKEEALKQKQMKMKERVSKFDRFLKENEAKRNRAMKKYQQEVKNNKLKAEELEQLNLELENLKKHRTVLVSKLAKNKIYERYMTSVLDVLPEDYLEMNSDTLILSAIQRYEGLSATNLSLVERNQYILSNTEEGQRQLDELRHETSKQKLVFNSELNNLQKKQEKLVRKNKLLEQSATNSLQKKRKALGDLGQILLGIENMAHQSHRRHWPLLHEMTWIQKLSMIQEYFLEREGVEKMVKKMMSEAAQNSMNINSGQMSTGGSKHTSSVANTKSVAGTSPRLDKTFPKKHNVLPPIKSAAPAPSTGFGVGVSSKSGANNFLERLTAISESHAE